MPFRKICYYCKIITRHYSWNEQLYFGFVAILKFHGGSKLENIPTSTHVNGRMIGSRICGEEGEKRGVKSGLVR